jgi:hypothetical protein
MPQDGQVWVGSCPRGSYGVTPGLPSPPDLLNPVPLEMLADHISANAPVNPNGSRLFTSLALVAPNAAWNICRQ